MNVNLDVLELIFEELNGSDLVASSLVSRAFLAGVIPSLYANVEYNFRHAKRAHYVISPFTTIAAHHHLVVHVKRIAIHAAPVFHPSSLIVCPAFLKDLAHTLSTATNLRSFQCTVKIIPPLLPHIVDKHTLIHLRLCASLSSRQMSVLHQRTALNTLSLDFPSSTVITALPTWSARMQKTLAHLTIYMAQDIDPTLLNTTLAHLPHLRGLHLIGSPRLTHIVALKALSHTPDLHELSFTIFPSQDNTIPPLNFSIPPLTHLAIDVRASYPGLQSLIARIISRLSPRKALAICGSWIGEIKGSSERPDPPQDPGNENPPPPGPAQNFVWQGHVHLHGPIPHPHALGNNHANDPPLLTPAIPHNINPPPNQNPGDHPPNPAVPPNFFGFPFPFPLGNPNPNNNANNLPGPGAPNPDLNPDPNLPSLVSSFPSTLSFLHIPQLSPTALTEVVDRCEDIQVLGIVIGGAFTSPTSIKGSKLTSQIKDLGARSGLRTEATVLAAILSHARALRELIIDTTALDSSGSSTGPDSRAGGPHGGALLTPLTVRTLMRESPSLRRIVGEGRVWESRTPTSSSPVPSPHHHAIDPTPSKARCGPGAGNNHVHGPPSFGTHGVGYSQIEASDDHWFWLTGSASRGRVYSR